MNVQVPQLLAKALAERGIVPPDLLETLEQSAVEQNKDFGQVLIDEGVITDAELTQLKSEIYNMPTVQIRGLKIPEDVTKSVPEHMTMLYRVVPFFKDENVLKIALLNPEDINALEALKFLAADNDLRLEQHVMSYMDFDSFAKGFHGIGSEVDKAIESITAKKMKSQKGDALADAETIKLENVAAEAPVTRVVASIIKNAVDTKASDIHIEPMHDAIRVRNRIDGVMQNVLSLPVGLLSALVTRIKILSDLKIDETRLAQDGRFSTTIGDREIDFRVSTFPTRSGEKVVLRILDPMVGDITLEDLGLAGRSLRLIHENIKKPFGAILVTGPTGSGKSTTLAATLRIMNSEDINIVTLEDPVEYYVEGVNQSQTHEEIGYTFAVGLRHILRQDPDVIMVGEIRDRETAQLATQASLTGHIVLSTLHTNDTIGVIPRLVDMGIEKYLLAPTLNLAVAQRLLRRLCQKCKQEVPATPSEKKMIEDAIATMPEESKARVTSQEYVVAKPGEGCDVCNNKAYKGRIGIFETLEMTDELERIVLTDMSEEKLSAEAKRQGMITMFQDGILKVLEGLTSVEELLQVAQNEEAVVKEPEQLAEEETQPQS